MKQFLYDWAPPAFDHPCLWKSHNEPFEVGKNIGWLGTDYRKAHAAAVSIDRTTIELSTEVDYVYEADEPPGRYLRLLVSPSNQAGGVAYPPRLDLQPCSTGVLSIHGQDVHHAFLTERYGPHEAVWQANGHNFMLLTKPSTDTDGIWFSGLLEQLLATDSSSHRE